MSILSFKDLLAALQKRHDFFESVGCRVSDHGLSTFYATPYTNAEIEAIFMKARMNKALTGEEIDKFRSAMLYELAVMDARSNWAQQFHIPACSSGGDAINTACMCMQTGKADVMLAVGAESHIESQEKACVNGQRNAWKKVRAWKKPECYE